jgi:hypothetical protein
MHTTVLAKLQFFVISTINKTYCKEKVTMHYGYARYESSTIGNNRKTRVSL